MYGVLYGRFGQVTLHLWMSCRLAETDEEAEEEEEEEEERIYKLIC